jgi:dynein light chain roadblock-type
MSESSSKSASAVVSVTATASSNNSSNNNNSSNSNSNSNLVELQETVSRLSSHKDVESVLVLNRTGDVVAASGSHTAARATHALVTTATAYIRALPVHDKDKDKIVDDLSFLQVRSKQGVEVLVAPHEGYVLAVIKRSPSSSSSS